MVGSPAGVKIHKGAQFLALADDPCQILIRKLAGMAVLPPPQRRYISGCHAGSGDPSGSPTEHWQPYFSMLAILIAIDC